MAAADVELNNAIAEATETLLKKAGKGGKETTETTEETQDTTESTEETTEETEETTDETDASSTTEELTESQLKEAQFLYKSLLNPELRGSIVAALAQQAGILKDNTPLETKKEVTEAKKGIAKIIEEALPEYPGLVAKLGPVIESIIENERNERNTEMEQIHAANVEKEVITELDLLAKETKGESRKFEVKMNQLMSDFSPGPNTTVKTYLRHLYTLATAGNTKAKVSSEMADKIRRNANNASERLATNTGTARTATLPDKKMSLNESVAWAQEQLAQQIVDGKKRK
jgi:hypothetical protein